MNIIMNGRMNFEVLKKATEKPSLYEASSHKFWDDPHIAKQMLKAHLNPSIEAASKTHSTISKEAEFLINSTGMNENTSVIDLGCGPGLYVDAFAKTGARVVGVDLSEGSIKYAKENIQVGNERVSFSTMNYLKLDDSESYDVATLIYYDFCALSMENQSTLLKNVHRALKKGGTFAFDVFSEHHKSDMSQSVSFEEGGFWSDQPYWVCKSTFMFTQPRVECFQYAIIDEAGDMKLIRVFHRLFNLKDIEELLTSHGFKVEKILKNLQGQTLEPNSTTYGIIASKL